MIKRRSFLTLLGGAAAAWPLAAWGQQPKLARIGVLNAANPEPAWSLLRSGLRAVGYVEGQNIAFEFRSGGGQLTLLRGLADELVRLKVDIIIAQSTPSVIAARQATTEIPIVMSGSADPVGLGLVSSLARPGGNITGLSTTTTDLASKTLELVRDVMPSLRRVAVLANAPDPFSRLFIEQIEEAGRTLSIAIQTIKVRGAEDFDTAFAAIVKERADAVIVQPNLPRKPLIDLALQHRIPLVGGNRSFPEDGALMSYFSNFSDQYHRAAYFVDRILKGAKPSDLPVEQPTRFELVVNLKTAKAIGLTIPETFLVRADEVIE